MNRKAVEWLYAELPGLVEAQVISLETAAALRRHYAGNGPAAGRTVALTVFSVIGATLIGLGLILLVAHNWPALGRPLRVVIALLPLLIGQLLAAYALKSQPASRAWAEGAASFVSLAVGLALALITQTYQAAGELGDLLLVWMLLSLPLVYLLGSSMVAAIYISGLTVWTLMSADSGLAPQLYWPLLAGVLPHFGRVAGSRRGALLGWVLALGGLVALITTLPALVHRLWLPIVATYLAAIYLTGATRARGGFWHRSLMQAAGLGCALIALLLTLKAPWRSLDWFVIWREAGSLQLAIQFGLLAGLSVWFVRLLLGAARAPEALDLLLGSLPLLVWLGYGLVGLSGASFASLLLFNLYCLSLGLLLLGAGFRTARLGSLNAGLGVLAALIVLRFFDANLSFVSRGLGFILIGAGFLTANLYLLRRREAGHE